MATDVEITMANPYLPMKSEMKDKIIETIEYLKNDEGVEFDMEFSDYQEYCKVTVKAKQK